MNRTVEDYDSMAKREMIKAKQEKAVMSVPPPTSLTSAFTICIPYRRVQKFRGDYNEFRSQFERLKTEVRQGRRSNQTHLTFAILSRKHRPTEQNS